VRKVVIAGNELCRTPVELLMSPMFERVLDSYVSSLTERGSREFDFLIEQGLARLSSDDGTLDMTVMKEMLVALVDSTPGEIARGTEGFSFLLEHSTEIYYLVENLYDYWRKVERFLVFEEDYRSSKEKTRDYHDWFRRTTGDFEELVRETYRRLANNLSGSLFKVYRQLPSGVGAGLLVETIPWEIPGKSYACLEGVRFIQLVIIEPPLIYYPRLNYRRGQFAPVNRNPLEGMDINPEEWFCFPARVGLLKCYIYFHSEYLPLGVSLSNLFELASGEDELREKPDCVLVFGAGGPSANRTTEYFEDEENDIVVGLVTGGEEIDYFGYLKKMTLTLHNITMINRGWFPIHGAMVNISLKTGRSANVVIVGDTGTGKSESIEAFRSIAEEYISDMEVIFDDMGVLRICEDGRIRAYGTEIGAFVRLDDLAPGYAYSEVDRSIFMNPQLTNARVVIPITMYDRVVRGHQVDLFLYANNYEEVDEEHPAVELFETAYDALPVFESGARLAKGTTDERGLVHSYFANPFGAVQKKKAHREISVRYFERMLESGTRLGQMRTRLGVEGYEFKGPQEAARVIFELINT
jgi:energy-coupling factor transporter ATP-binding protein EcfA2